MLIFCRSTGWCGGLSDFFSTLESCVQFNFNWLGGSGGSVVFRSSLTEVSTQTPDSESNIFLSINPQLFCPNYIISGDRLNLFTVLELRKEWFLL